jgi:uncharacterized protein (TIGR03067 family)
MKSPIVLPELHVNKLSASLVVSLLLTSLSWADAKDDAKAMKGVWLPVSADLGGQPFPDALLKSMKLTLTDGKYSVQVGPSLDEGTFVLDATKKPATMDITGKEGPNKGKTLLAIYELDGDSLKVCYDLSGKARPTEFKAAPKIFLVVYKRGKP